MKRFWSLFDYKRASFDIKFRDERQLKILLLVIFIIIVGGPFLFLYFAFDESFKGLSYNKQDLINNYETRKGEIIELKSFIDSKIPSDTYIHIEFEDEKLGIFHVSKNDHYNNNWDLEIDSKKTDSLLKKIAWTKNDLKSLKEKLEKANSISVASGNPITIGWKRSGSGMFFYKVFDQNLSESLINKYDNGCTYIFYKDNVVLEYGGGAFGSQCFPSSEQKN